MTQSIRPSAILALIFFLQVAAFGIAHAQSTTNYSELQNQSALLTPEQRNVARNILEAGFSLWQSGDFGAATKAFKKGLSIDPANALGNYYLAESLLKSRNRGDAAEYFLRAATFGPGTVEGFKAEQALDDLRKPQQPSEMSQTELEELLIGAWGEKKKPGAYFSIRRNSQGQLEIEGETCSFICGDLERLLFDGKTIKFDHSSMHFFELHFKDRDTLDGIMRALGSIYPSGLFKRQRQAPQS